jgi:hypothetical protein
MSRFANLKVLVYESCATDLIQLSAICGDKRMITIKTEEVLNFCQKFPNLKVFQFEALFLRIREESIALMLNMWPNLEVFILMSFLLNIEPNFEVENYKELCFKEMSYRNAGFSIK